MQMFLFTYIYIFKSLHLYMYMYIHTTLHCITLRFNTIQWQYIYSTFSVQYITLHHVILHTYMPAKVHQIARTEVVVRNFQGQKSVKWNQATQKKLFTYTVYLYFFGTPCPLPTRAHWMIGGHHENTKLIWKHHFTWKWLFYGISIG